MEHARFRDVGRWLSPSDLLVVNNSRVLPARLVGERPGGGAAEVLVLRTLPDDPRWEALVRPSRRLAVGSFVTLRSGDRVEVGERLTDGTRIVRFERDAHAVMADAGEMPLPPYIRDRSSPAERYQTVYARPPGSAAAPTAGLHFTDELLASLESAGVSAPPLPCTSGSTRSGRWRASSSTSTGSTASGTRCRQRRARHWRTQAASWPWARPRCGCWRPAARTDAARGLDGPVRHAAVSVQGGRRADHELPSAAQLAAAARDRLRPSRDGGRAALDARDRLLASYRKALAEGYRFFSFGDAMLIV